MKVKIGELTKIKTGKLDANAASEEGQYPFFTCSKEPLRISTYSYDCECVLVAGNGDLNVKYYNGKFDAYQRTYIIEDNSSGKLYMPYLYYFMEGYIEELRKQAIGGVIKYIKLGNLTDALIELPSVDEQKSMVEILVKAKGILEKRNDELNSLDDLIKARFIELFGDYINEGGKPLSELATITGGLTKNSKRNTFNLKMPYLRVANVFFNRLDLNEILEIGVREDEIGKTLLEAGDLLFVEGNGSIEQIGRVAIWDGSINQILHQNHLIKARFHKKTILPEFALFYFMSQEGRQQIISKSVSTSGLNTLSVNKISSLILPMPPIELQERFAAFVTQVDKLKVAVQRALDKAQLLFDSLMQEYFG